MGEWFDIITHWLGNNPQWLGLAVLLTSFFECLAIIGLLIPGTLVLFTLGVLAGNGVLGAGETLLLAFVGGLLGDIASYGIGRHYHQGIRRLPVLRSKPEWLALAEQYFQRYGIASLLVGRFIGAVRPFLPLTAGMLDMPFVRFVLVSIPASFSWAAVYLLPGWTAGAALRLPLPDGFWYEVGIVVGGLAGLLAILFYASLRNQRHTPWLAAGLCLISLLGLSIAWPQMQALDQGLMSLIQQTRYPLMDQLMVFITRLGDLSIQLGVGLLLVALLAVAKHWQSACFVAVSLLGTALLNTALKYGFSRARPELLAEPLASHSYPSGHSSAAFAFFLVLGILAGRQQVLRLRLAWLLLASLPALAVAGSRVYLGVHWPTDVLAGSLLAATCCAATLGWIQRRSALPALPAVHNWVILALCLGSLLVYGLWELPETLVRYQQHTA